MANIRDVAREAGTSIATVSRILSNDSSFEATQRTRQNVLDAAQRLQYHAKALRKVAKKAQIGCVLALTAEKYSDPFFTSILSAMEEECVSHNALISIIRNFNELKNPVVLSDICSFGLKGLILMESLPDYMLNQLTANIAHIIAIDLPTSQFNSVGFDNYESSIQVMNCLFDHGYRRIAYIGGSSSDVEFDFSHHLTAYREVLYRNGISYDPSLVMDCRWDLDQCAECAARLLSLQHPPEAIFAGSDTLASVILSTIHKMGLRCPQDVGVIGFNNVSGSSHMAPPLSTVNVPTRDIGIEAIRRLMELFHGKDKRIMKISFPTQIVLRDSLRQIR